VALLVLIYLFGQNLTLRKVGFFGAVAFLVIFILANVFAFQQKRQLENRNGAIVIAPSASVKKTPADNSETTFVLHEGTKVYITDKSINKWTEVKIADGRSGWLTNDKIEEI
jgi:uncharacterized protein YgiM (DUF1202 family)